MVADGAQPIGSGVQFPSFPFRRENYHILAFHITTASCKSNRRARDLGQTQAEGWEGRKTIGQNGVLTSANKSSMDKCVCGMGGRRKREGDMEMWVGGIDQCLTCWGGRQACEETGLLIDLRGCGHK